MSMAKDYRLIGLGLIAVGAALLGCGTSNAVSSTPHAFAGTYEATSDSAITEISFYDATHYFLWRGQCDEAADECVEGGTYAVDDAHSIISFTNAATGQTTELPFQVLQSTDAASQSIRSSIHTAGTAPLGSGAGSGGSSLYTTGTALVESFTANGETLHRTGDCGAKDGDAGAAVPFIMPPEIICFEAHGHWGDHHLEWHTERQWDLLNPSDLQWAQSQTPPWKRAAIQEGQAGNGLEFLMMHRAMILTLKQMFPADARYFDGWSSPPTDPSDSANPLPGGGTTPFDPNMLQAIQTVQNSLSKFGTDDDIGLYLETSLRPTAADPKARSTDPTVGIHNYLHNRWADSSSPVDMGDPSKNLGNQIFWRLHGWIDGRWAAFRTAKGLSDSDPQYQAALQKEMSMFQMRMGGAMHGQPSGTPPTSLTQFFDQEQNW